MWQAIIMAYHHADQLQKPAVAALARVPAWLAAALVAAPVVLAELPGGNGVLLAIPFALAGGFGGAFARRRIATGYRSL